MELFHPRDGIPHRNLGQEGKAETIRPSVASDDSLLRRIRAGDQEAFRAVYQRCQGPVYRFALHMSGRRSVAEDVTQEVFMLLIDEGCNFDSSKGALPAYLIGVARNQLARHLAKELRYVPFPDDPLGLPPSQKTNGNGKHHERLIVAPVDLAQQETTDRLRQAILNLPANYREAVVLCDLQEMSYEEASRILDCAVGTVRSRLHRGRAFLMDKLRSACGVGRASAAGGKSARQ
jgi:RNA polymerase sigma-70 factor, ECF subfamily